jgi:hypothetical protein
MKAMLSALKLAFTITSFSTVSKSRAGLHVYGTSDVGTSGLAWSLLLVEAEDSSAAACEAS